MGSSRNPTVRLAEWETEPIFGKCSHLRGKGGVLMLLKTTLHLGAKAQYFWDKNF
jgi:hypothetical protein